MLFDEKGITLIAGNGYRKTEQRILIPWVQIKYANEGIRWECLDHSGGTSAILNESIEIDSTTPYKREVVCRSWGADYEGTPWETITKITVGR